MKVKAIAKASRELMRCQRKLQQMQFSTDVSELADAWSDFLDASQRFFNKITNGAKGSGWFGKRVIERKTDPLLQYIHQARHADQHGIGDIVLERHLPVINIGGSGTLQKLVIGPNMLIRELQHDPSIKVEFQPAGVQLIAVENGNQVYPVPSTHLGKPIASANPIHVAELVCDYMSELLREAEQHRSAPGT